MEVAVEGQVLPQMAASFWATCSAPVFLKFGTHRNPGVGMIPACAIRATATSYTSLFHVPEASITA